MCSFEMRHRCMERWGQRGGGEKKREKRMLQRRHHALESGKVVTVWMSIGVLCVHGHGVVEAYSITPRRVRRGEVSYL